MVRAVYEHFGLPMDGVEPALRAWLDDPGNHGDRFGKWAYDLAGYEISVVLVSAAPWHKPNAVGAGRLIPQPGHGPRRDRLPNQLNNFTI